MIILPTMRWFSSISFTSTHTPATSSSPSSKAADTPSTGIGRESPRRRSKSSGGACDDRHYRRGIWPFGASKPWRQKRHDVLSDGEFTTGGASSSKWTGIAAEPVALSRCPSNFEYALPLPLPESPCDISPRKSEVFVNLNFSGDGDCPLPSPKDVPTKTVEQRDRDIDLTRATHKIGDGDLSHTPTKSPYSYQERPVKKDHGESKASRNRNQSSGRSPKNFRVKVPVWSAFPTTLISPNTSPPRMRASDSLSFYYSAPNKGFQTWSAPENPSSPVNPGVSPPRFYHRSSISTDNSPLQSPQGRSPHGFIVHPLPLPPGGSLPSPSAHTSQVTAKLEALQIKNNWQKGKLIGRGTFGSVYVATNRETGALCAMKEVELFPDDPKSAESIKQLEQEIKILSQLKHPNIVQYYGSETVDDKFYIYLEYIHPGSINKYVREHCGAITESVVRNFTRHILSGLAYLHSTKTIHRDIKGANLLVDSCGVVKLADFGMSKHLTGVAAELSLKGSPYWMAPELMQAIMQKDNHPDLALAIDIWSLGCTIIEMLTGKPPWSEFEGVAAMFKVMRDTPPIPDSLSSEGKDFLRCCFERNPADRATASMLLEHQFVKNSSRPDIPTSIHESIGITNLTDKLSSPREQSPSMQIAMGNTGVERESGQQSHYHENSERIVTARHSPRSTLETLISLSPPRPVPKLCPPSPPRLCSNWNHVAKKNQIMG